MSQHQPSTKRVYEQPPISPDKSFAAEEIQIPCDLSKHRDERTKAAKVIFNLNLDPYVVKIGSPACLSLFAIERVPSSISVSDYVKLSEIHDKRYHRPASLDETIVAMANFPKKFIGNRLVCINTGMFRSGENNNPDDAPIGIAFPWNGFNFLGIRLVQRLLIPGDVVIFKKP